MRTIRILLHELIDYAGLFPPASLDMATAVANYAAYRVADHAWALGRLIVPVARLQEFEVAAGPLLQRADAGPWRISALAGPNLSVDLEKIAEFNRRHSAESSSAVVTIEAIELKVARAEQIASAMRWIAAPLQPYVEIPIDDDPRDLVAALAQAGARAKVRTGGVSQDMFPTAADLARFLHACAEAGLAFKATSGLHHPIRSTYRLTYEPSSPFGTMHGFLNVFLAAALLYAGASIEVAAELIAETSPAALCFDEQGVAWRGHWLSAEAIARARQQFAMSFGSCSFREPIDDLKAIGLL
jgi:hypothetical protein